MVGIFSMTMVAVTALFMSVLSGASKADAISRIRENGDMALLMLERRIREGNQCSVSGNNLTISYPNRPDGSERDDLEISFADNTITVDGNEILSDGVNLVEAVTPGCVEGVPGFGRDRVSIVMGLTTGEVDGRRSERYVETFRTQITLRNVRPDD